MTLRKFLMVLMLTMSVYMTYLVITTSLKSNLFKEWDYLASIPWMVTTIRDFYQNLLLICIWVFYKEGWVKGGLWSLVFVMLGSIATPIYVFIQLYRLKPGESLEKILLRSR